MGGGRERWRKGLPMEGNLRERGKGKWDGDCAGFNAKCESK